MKRLVGRMSERIGLIPGSTTIAKKKKSRNIPIDIIDYDSKKFIERKNQSLKDCFSYKKTSTVSWIDIDGLEDVDLINAIGKHYDIHPLVLEDILHTVQRPKVEFFEEKGFPQFFVLFLQFFQKKIFFQSL